ncbi:hypothetical protein N7455_011417, partial [Penicillium solitum]|uniref:uncharacterized protein n=1 Tax=Penicillium solitum TaxID=60172 RepID=UPI0032C3DB6C
CHIEHDIIPNGTIAQLGERATEVRKVAGSIPARPITFFITLKYLSIFIPSGTIAQLGERATEVRKTRETQIRVMLVRAPKAPKSLVRFIMPTWASIFIPNGTIAQLGERATEVRKVAGSIPARPIIFCFFPAQVLGIS